MIKTHELTLQPGLIMNQEFFDYPTMQESAENWIYQSRYRFGTGAFYGSDNVVQLNHLQFGHADIGEGMMIEGLSPKDCLTIAILQKSMGMVCVNRLKIKPGEIVIIDDAKPYDFVSSHGTVWAIVSIRKSLLVAEIPSILSAKDKKFKDKNTILSDTIENEWKRVSKEPNLFDDIHEIEIMEIKILKAIKDFFVEQTGEECHLKKGEKTAFEVRSFLLNSLEKKMTIQSIAEQFKVSNKTLESSFKSLFGITPKQFIKMLKLNHAHEDLKLADKQTTKVSDIGRKWGFLHLGRFSKDYKALFGVLPSETLMAVSIQS